MCVYLINVVISLCQLRARVLGETWGPACCAAWRRCRPRWGSWGWWWTPACRASPTSCWHSPLRKCHWSSWYLDVLYIYLIDFECWCSYRSRIIIVSDIFYRTHVCLRYWVARSTQLNRSSTRKLLLKLLHTASGNHVKPCCINHKYE